MTVCTTPTHDAESGYTVIVGKGPASLQGNRCCGTASAIRAPFLCAFSRLLVAGGFTREHSPNCQKDNVTDRPALWTR